MVRDLASSGPVRGVLFDLDGTLVESPIDFARMRATTIGIAELHGAETADLVGLDALAIRTRASDRVQDRARFEEDVERALREIELSACRRARAVLGARSLLAAISRARVGVGIVTRNCRAAAQEAMRGAGLECDVLLTREDVPRVKPDPIHLLVAAERLGLPPDALVMVGDHAMDVRGGRAAGMLTVGYAPTQEAMRRLSAEGPDHLVSHLEEIELWISRW